MRWRVTATKLWTGEYQHYVVWCELLSVMCLTNLLHCLMGELNSIVWGYICWQAGTEDCSGTRASLCRLAIKFGPRIDNSMHACKNLGFVAMWRRQLICDAWSKGRVSSTLLLRNRRELQFHVTPRLWSQVAHRTGAYDSINETEKWQVRNF